MLSFVNLNWNPRSLNRTFIGFVVKGERMNHSSFQALPVRRSSLPQCHKNASRTSHPLGTDIVGKGGIEGVGHELN